MENNELVHLLTTYGYIAVMLGVTVDSFGVPVPGEVMLLTASVYAGATHHLAILLVVAAATAGGILGDNLSFLLGKEGGSRLLKRYGRYIHIDKRRRRLARYLFIRHGAKVVISGRFVPVLHIWTAFLAGTNDMPWPKFLFFDGIACAAWASALGTAGYFFGTVALHLGGILAGLSIPIAGIVVVAVVVILRFTESRLQREADQALEGSEQDAA